MKPSDAVQPQAETPGGSMILVLGGVAMLAGLLVVLTAQWTAPRIAENQRRAIEQAVSRVVPGSVRHRAWRLRDGALQPPGESQSGTPVYAAYDAQGQLLGVAAQGAAQGYADLVHLLYGYDPTCSCIRGFEVLKMAETPGLGDKIIKDPAFLANFQALDARLNERGDALANPIRTVKHGARRNPWEIDAISGATISSVAVGRAINASAAELLPALHPLLPQLQTEDPSP